MYRHLNSLAVFAAVVEEGGFRKGAAKFELAPSAASHHVSKLEERLGVALLYRSTRKIGLTPEGRRVFEAAQAALAVSEDAFDAVSQQTDNPAGALRIAMPSYVPDARLENGIWRFVERFPKVDLSLSYSDQMSDLIEDRFDIGFRIGDLPDSSLTARKVASARLRLCASPTYLEHAPPLERPEDLEAHACIALEGFAGAYTLERGDARIDAAPRHRRVTVNAIQAGYSACRAGLGVMRLPADLSAPDVAAGRLVEVLPGWSLPTRPVYAVWSGGARRNSLIRRLIDFLEDELQR